MIRSHTLLLADDLPSLASLDYEDPFAVYGRLQHQDPVHWSEHLQAWVVTRFDDVRNGLRSNEMSVRREDVHFGGLSEADQARFMPLRKFYRSWLMFLDPPRHTLLRRLVMEALRQAFTPAVRDRIDSIADTVVADFASCPQRCGELVEGVAKKIAMGAIGAMFGLNDRETRCIECLSAPIVAYLDGRQRHAAKAERAQQSMFELVAYLKGLLTQRRRWDHGDDLITALVRQPMGRGLVNDEVLVALCVNILVDSHEPIVSTIAGGMATLINDRGALCSRLDAPDLTNEVLRLTTPFQYCARRTLCPVQVGARVIPARHRVLLMTCAANMDDRRFPSPSEVRADRPAAAHLAFGFGRHYCVGASLARYTIGAAFSALLKAIPQPSIDAGRLVWRQSMGFRAPLSLHIRW